MNFEGATLCLFSLPGKHKNKSIPEDVRYTV